MLVSQGDASVLLRIGAIRNYVGAACQCGDGFEAVDSEKRHDTLRDNMFSRNKKTALVTGVVTLCGFKETSMDDVARAARLSSAGTVFALCEQDRAVPRIASPRARGESAGRRPIEHVGRRVTGPPAP